MADIRLEVTGLDKVREAFARWPQVSGRYLTNAGKEVGAEIVNTEGLKKYPAPGPGNAPPTPYYIRGQGTQYASYLKHTSEDYQAQFYVEPKDYVTVIGNRASYAKWLASEQQARRMAALGWRRLYEVAEEKRPELEKIYQGWINLLLKDVGLV